MPEPVAGQQGEPGPDAGARGIAVKINFTVRGLMASYPDFSYNGENGGEGFFCGKRGLKGAFTATKFH